MDELWSSRGLRESYAGLREDQSGRSCAGARVLILRPKGQASLLRERLDVLGAVTLSVPVLEIASPSSFGALDAALAAMDGFDWVILTSANAVDAVAARLPAESRMARLAVIGAATLARVRAVALSEPALAPVLMPVRAVAEALAGELEPHVRKLIAEQGRARVLLPQAETARDVLPERLRAAGAEVTVVPAYRNGIPPASVAVLREIFSQPALWPDAIPFTSSSSVTHLLTVLEAAGQALPPEILRISIGPVTSATLRENGLPPHAEAVEASIDSLVEAILIAVTQTREMRG